MGIIFLFGWERGLESLGKAAQGPSGGTFIAFPGELPEIISIDSACVRFLVMPLAEADEIVIVAQKVRSFSQLNYVVGFQVVVIQFVLVKTDCAEVMTSFLDVLGLFRKGVAISA